jgi:hypothetical protein
MFKELKSGVSDMAGGVKERSKTILSGKISLPEAMA